MENVNGQHPSIQKFKEFVQANPLIIQEVREGKATWQQLYEEWYLLGEEDKRWEHLRTGTKEQAEVKETEKKTDWLGQILGVVKNMDPNQVQGHLENLSQAIGAVQGIIGQFQGSGQGKASSKNTSTRKAETPSHPFLFRKD